MTDKYWKEDIVDIKILKFSNSFNTSEELWTYCKKDWYDLDLLYLYNNPNFKAWNVYLQNKDLKNSYINIFSEEAFSEKQNYLKKFYQIKNTDFERKCIYLNESEMNQFVDVTVSKIISIYSFPVVNQK